MNVFIFIVLNFIVGFISDIVLNVTNLVPTLKSYFANKSILESAAYAGITIIVALLVVMGFSKVFFGFFIPNTNAELVKYSILAFTLGFMIDIFIYRMKVFGTSLDLYYKTAGAGFWGASSLLFSILISYFTQKYIISNNNII